MSNQGFIVPLLVMLVIVAIAAGGITYYYVSSQNQAATPIPTTSGLPSVRPITGANQNQPASPATVAATVPANFTGAILAGSTSPLLDFNQADYEAAKNSGKLVALYFYADWCPICQEEFPKMVTAFNQLSNANVVGFRVNYNDDATDDFEVALAREHGVAYQHTKVLVKNGQQILKSPETWETNRYITEITNAAR